MPTSLPTNNCRAGAQYKKRPRKSTTSIHSSLQEGVTLFDYTSERRNQSATYQKGGTSFDCTAMLPSGDRALKHSAEAMPISASSPPGTWCHLPRCNPRHHLRLPYPAWSQVQPLTGSASKRNSIKMLPLTAALWQILRFNRHTCNHVIPATAHYTLLYDYQDLNKYLYICSYCSYSMTTLQYPIYVILCIFVTCFIFNCLGTNVGYVKCIYM